MPSTNHNFFWPQLIIGSELFVAKRFLDIVSDEVMSAELNHSSLKHELTRLKMISWLLSQFKARAKKDGIDIVRGMLKLSPFLLCTLPRSPYNSDIAVSEGFLIQELGLPSSVSDLPPVEDTAVWLVEPRRTTSVQKFSGTLVHPSPRSDKLAITISAFSHFVYEMTHQDLVLADIQGTMTLIKVLLSCAHRGLPFTGSPMTINGRNTIILFDFMTHSREGSVPFYLSLPSVT